MDTDIDLKPFPKDYKTALANTRKALEPIRKRITLKGLKHAAFASQETLCFSASIYLDGRKVGDVHSDGMGGDACLYFADYMVERNLANEIRDAIQRFDGETTPRMGLSDLVVDIAEEMVEEKKIAAFIKRVNKKGLHAVVVENDSYCGGVDLYGIPPHQFAKALNDFAREGRKVRKFVLAK